MNTNIVLLKSNRWEWKARTPRPARLHLRLLLAFLILPTVCRAEFRYETFGEGISITGYDCIAGDVSIPRMLDGLPVLRIGQSAFLDCDLLSNVTLPASVTQIDVGAFRNCTALETVTISGDVTDIGDLAFAGCVRLKGVNLPSTVTRIGDYAFLGCASLPSLQMPSGLSSIGRFAFQGCTSLDGVAIPDSVTLLEGGAFSDCTNLTRIAIPGSVSALATATFLGCTRLATVVISSGVISIGDLAFYQCTSLTNLALPRSLSSIEISATHGCTELTAITVDPENSTYGSLDGVLYDKSFTTLIQCPAGKAGGHTFPASVIRIGDLAFLDCTRITSVTLSAGVTHIGEQALSGCKRLASVTIPSSLLSIGHYAFRGCADLTSVCFQGNAPDLGQAVFELAESVIVYRWAASTGWGALFGERPVVVGGTDSTVSITPSLELALVGAPGSTQTLLSRLTLDDTEAWQVMTNVTLEVTGRAVVRLPPAPGRSGFYRLRVP